MGAFRLPVLYSYGGALRTMLRGYISHYIIALEDFNNLSYKRCQKEIQYALIKIPTSYRRVVSLSYISIYINRCQSFQW